MSENERGWNLSRVIENTKDAGMTLVLIIDESHRAAKTSKSKEIVEIIGPSLTIEVSATPKENVTNDHKITVSLAEVVKEGMIKREIQLNPGLGKIQTNEDIVIEALKKRKELRKLYSEAGANVNPLLLIQIPKKKRSDAREPEDKIIEILNNQGITLENKQLALWLAPKDKKINLEYLEKNDSEVDVLVFKEAIALGWDCPRAAILLLQREWNSENYVFNIQTLGRIMRMPEQTHYENFDALNIGYVYTASNNFEIVEDLAKDYVSQDQMRRDNSRYKNLHLPSELIRRKRELHRLSGEFKECLFDAAKELKIDKKKINLGEITYRKTVGLHGTVSALDKKQDVEFQKEREIVKDREEINAEYTAFIKSHSHPYTGGTRPTGIIKSSIRSFFKKTLAIDNEDTIASIVLNPMNNSEFIDLIQVAKSKYEQLPERADEVVLNPEWQIPEQISVFENYYEVKDVQKSLLLPYFVKRDKNGKQQWSKPEKKFIEELETTDDDVLWWFKNGVRESKYFGIAYRKSNGDVEAFYAFYPDFIIKTKKEILIIEIKDDHDFKNEENLLKLNAGRNYQAQYKGPEALHFFIVSPSDYFNFFRQLRNREIRNYKSKFEENLLRYWQSKKLTAEKKPSSADQQMLVLYEEELNKAIENLDDKNLENEILKMDLANAETTIRNLRDVIAYQEGDSPTRNQELEIERPFNLCIIGDTADRNHIRVKLREYFSKFGIPATDWNVEFFDNAKLRSVDVLAKLKKGKTKFKFVITGQIYHHSGRGNKSANILTELKKPIYIEHFVGSSPTELLSADEVLKILDKFLHVKQGLTS